MPLGTVSFGIVFKNSTKRNRPQWYYYFAENDYICSININLECMEQYPCENCKFRPHYDRNPKSLIGRFWRWHINFCPGWKQYFTHQTPEKQAELRERYHFEKYKE